MKDDIIAVPKHIRRIDLTKLTTFDFQEKFMDEECKQCIHYDKCISSTYQELTFYYSRCSRHIMEAFYECNLLRNILAQRNLLTKETLSDYQGTQSLECVKQLRLIAQMPDVYKGNYYLYGDNSTQKTTMAKALAKKLCYPIVKFKRKSQVNPVSDNINVVYTNMNQIMKLLAKESNLDAFKDEKTDLYLTLPLIRNARYLFIDESFDPTKATFYKTGFLLGDLDELLRSRLEDCSKSTYFISNIKPENIDEELFGKSLKELVKRSMEQVLEFKDKYSSNRIPTRQVRV